MFAPQGYFLSDQKVTKESSGDKIGFDFVLTHSLTKFYPPNPL